MRLWSGRVLWPTQRISGHWMMDRSASNVSRALDLDSGVFPGTGESGSGLESWLTESRDLWEKTGVSELKSGKLSRSLAFFLATSGRFPRTGLVWGASGKLLGVGEYSLMGRGDSIRLGLGLGPRGSFARTFRWANASSRVIIF